MTKVLSPRLAVLLCALFLATLVPGAGGQATGQALDLATIFEAGHLVADENGDGVPDRLQAAIVLGPSPTEVELAAASEIAARLGFETMAMDLPVRRSRQGNDVGILIGDRAVRSEGLDVSALEGSSENGGAVVTFEQAGARWVAVLGDTEPALARAARLLAGTLPHTHTLSTPSLSDVAAEVAAWLQGDSLDAASDYQITFESAALGPDDGAVQLGATLRHPDAEVLQTALVRVDSLAQARGSEEASDSTTLRYRGLAAIAFRLEGETQRRATLPVAAPPNPAGPVASRPGAGGKGSLDLSNIYTNDGLLGDSDRNQIPDRIEGVLVPGPSGATLLPDLAARLGLESTGLTVPLVRLPGDIDEPGKEPTMVLVGAEHPLIAELVDSGATTLADLAPGEGLIELVPDAFGDKPSLVVTGPDVAGAERALSHLATTFPHVSEARGSTPTLDAVEKDLWALLSGHSPAGQAATALYKLDRILADLEGPGEPRIREPQLLVSVEKPEPGLEALIRERLGAAGIQDADITIDNRDVQQAASIFADDRPVPSEVDRFWAAFEANLMPEIAAGSVVELEVRISEPPAVRQRVADEAVRRLEEAGARENPRVRVLSAFKQGFSWLDEVVGPTVRGESIQEIVIAFKKNEAPEEWPQQAIHTPVRWLHEIYPIDEVLARDLDLPRERIRFEMVEGAGPIYAVTVTGEDSSTLYEGSFDPKWVLRPYFDRFQDYEHVRVTTGWINAAVDGNTVVDERIVTDPEWVWDHFQSATLPAVYDYVMDRHEGNPRGGGRDAPYFGELTVEVELSEPDYRLEIDNEIIAPMDALHEEVYFGTIEFFHQIGRNSRGDDLTYPGRVLPFMRPKSDGEAGVMRTSLTGFATGRPTVVLRYVDSDGRHQEKQLDISKVTMERPSARRMVVGEDLRLDLRVRVDTELDERESLLAFAPPERVDETMISGAQVAAVLANLESLRAAGSYLETLAYDGLGQIGVWSEWTHEQDPESRLTAELAPNGVPLAAPVWSGLVPDDWSYDGERIVQWETPIPPPEGHEMLAKMSAAFEHATMYPVGESYLGKTTWAADLTPPVTATHRSLAKATTFKPTVVYSARQHANEVSSTSHVLRHAELLLTDPEQRKKLDKVNVVIHPFTNPDGAQLAYDLFRTTPDYILHAGYLASLGMDATSGSGDDFPIYPESNVRNRIWNRWLPDIFLNPHGYPSHQVVQLFSEYTGLVRRGRVTERNWGFNKGWFMPGFGYVDDPEFPRHRDAAFEIRDYITSAINSNADVFELNQRSYARYRRYGADYDPDVFRLPMVDSVLIEMPLKGAKGQVGGRGYNPNVTIWSGTTEAPDETAYGDYMKLVASAGLSWDQAILNYLYEGDHEVERSGSTFFGGVTLKMNRPRPPKAKEEEEPS